MPLRDEHEPLGVLGRDVVGERRVSRRGEQVEAQRGREDELVQVLLKGFLRKGPAVRVVEPVVDGVGGPCLQGGVHLSELQVQVDEQDLLAGRRHVGGQVRGEEGLAAATRRGADGDDEAGLGLRFRLGFLLGLGQLQLRELVQDPVQDRCEPVLGDLAAPGRRDPVLLEHDIGRAVAVDVRDDR